VWIRLLEELIMFHVTEPTVDQVLSDDALATLIEQPQERHGFRLTCGGHDGSVCLRDTPIDLPDYCGIAARQGLR
jgi:hypothetical protein